MKLAKAEVVVPPPQDRIYPPDDAPQTLSVVASGMLSKLLFQSVLALLARPLLSPFEMLAQEVETTSLGCIDDLGFVRV
jgi:hypothetical protein